MSVMKEQLLKNLDDVINNLQTYKEELQKEECAQAYLDLANRMVSACDKEGVYFNYLVACEQANHRSEEPKEEEKEDVADNQAAAVE